MKVLFVNTLYYPNIIGGAERSLQVLAESLVKQGHEGVVVSTSPKQQLEIAEVNGVKVYYIPLKNLFWPFGDRKPAGLKKLFWHTIDTLNPWMAQEVDKIIDIETPDILHTNNLMGFSTLVWKTAKKRNIPIVHTLRDYSLLCRRAIMYKEEKNCTTQCRECKPFVQPRKYLSQHVDAVVGISRYILNRHTQLNYFSGASIQKVIFNSYQAKSNINSTEIYQQKKDTLQIGFLGRLEPSKGLQFLLEVLKQIPNEKWELWIGGKGASQYEEYLHNSYSMPNVHFLGFVKPEDFFSKIDLLVVPSLWNEPLGRTVFEAYAYGIPVIGSNRGGIPEIIDEGKTGLIFDSDNNQQLLYILYQVIKQPKSLLRMRQYCQEKVNIFAYQRIFNEYLEVYHRLN